MKFASKFFAILSTVIATLSGASSVSAEEFTVRDVKVGEGDAAISGKPVTVHYTGWLYKNGEKGAKFDSSLDRGTPFTFDLGAGQVIRGWEEGVPGMKIGGQRSIIIPPEMGYGANGAPPVIPPNATLVFEVELIKVG